MTLESTKSRAANKKNTNDKNACKSGGNGGGGGSSGNKRNVDTAKFENYFKFSIPVKYAKPHQVRGLLVFTVEPG